MSAKCGQGLVEVGEVTQKGNDVAARLSIYVGEEKSSTLITMRTTSTPKVDGVIFSETRAAFNCT